MDIQELLRGVGFFASLLLSTYAIYLAFSWVAGFCWTL
jgi:hypothetical protein